MKISELLAQLESEERTEIADRLREYLETRKILHGSGIDVLLTRLLNQAPVFTEKGDPKSFSMADLLEAIPTEAHPRIWRVLVSKTAMDVQRPLYLEFAKVVDLMEAIEKRFNEIREKEERVRKGFERLSTLTNAIITHHVNTEA